MTTFAKSAVLGIVAGLGLAAPAWAQSNCDLYARTALQQQQMNEKLKCGLKGPEWNADLRAHVTWCSAVAPDAWRQQAQRREQALNACGGKRS